jgi:hypothetical protein
MTGRSRSSTIRKQTSPSGLWKELLEAGSVAPVIDRCYPLHKAAEALR